MTTPTFSLGDGVERVVDTVVMSLAKAASRQRPVSAYDIEDSVGASYEQLVADEVLARLTAVPCGDDCPMLEGIGHTAASFVRIIINHVALEIDLLGQLERATGSAPVDTLRRVLERVAEADKHGR